MIIVEIIGKDLKEEQIIVSLLNKYFESLENDKCLEFKQKMRWEFNKELGI